MHNTKSVAILESIFLFITGCNYDPSDCPYGNICFEVNGKTISGDASLSKNASVTKLHMINEDNSGIIDEATMEFYISESGKYDLNDTRKSPSVYFEHFSKKEGVPGSIIIKIGEINITRFDLDDKGLSAKFEGTAATGEKISGVKIIRAMLN